MVSKLWLVQMNSLTGTEWSSALVESMEYVISGKAMCTPQNFEGHG